MAASASRSRGRPTLDEAIALEGRILDVALDEFIEHGYGGGSLSRIVQTAGISKTTLYARYSSKEELFRAVMNRAVEAAMADDSLNPVKDMHDVEGGLFAFGDRMLEFSLSTPLFAVNRLICSEGYRFPELEQIGIDKLEFGVRYVSDYLRRCSEREGFVVNDPDGVARAYVHMLRGWYLHMILSNATVTTKARRDWVQTSLNTIMRPGPTW